MGKQIRRTITITLTETWTFVWAKTDDAPEQTITVEPVTPVEKKKEEQDAALQLPVSTFDRANPSVDEPLSSLDTTQAPQPGDDTTLAISLKPKRSRRRRSPGKRSGT